MMYRNTQCFMAKNTRSSSGSNAQKKGKNTIATSKGCAEVGTAVGVTANRTAGTDGATEPDAENEEEEEEFTCYATSVEAIQNVFDALQKHFGQTSA